MGSLPPRSNPLSMPPPIDPDAETWPPSPFGPGSATVKYQPPAHTLKDAYAMHGGMQRDIHRIVNHLNAPKVHYKHAKESAALRAAQLLSHMTDPAIIELVERKRQEAIKAAMDYERAQDQDDDSDSGGDTGPN